MHEEQSNRQHPSMASALVPASRFLPCVNSCLTALDDELLYGQEQNKAFPLKLLLVMLFHHSNSDPKTDDAPLHYGGSCMLPAMGETCHPNQAI